MDQAVEPHLKESQLATIRQADHETFLMTERFSDYLA